MTDETDASTATCGGQSTVASRVVPASAIISPDTSLLRQYADLIPSNEHHAALLVFPDINRDVLDEMKDLIRNNREWEMPFKRKASALFRMQVNPSSFEKLMRHWLAVTPYVSSGNPWMEGVSPEKALHTTYRMQLQWGSFEDDWDDNIAAQARGCAVAACIVVNHGELVGSLKPDDAKWIGQHADAVLNILPVLSDRRWFTRELIEPLLEANANALAEGSL